MYLDFAKCVSSMRYILGIHPNLRSDSDPATMKHLVRVGTDLETWGGGGVMVYSDRNRDRSKPVWIHHNSYPVLTWGVPPSSPIGGYPI